MIMKITIIDETPRKSICHVCHKGKLTMTIALSAGSHTPVISEDWCKPCFHKIQDKTLSLQ